MPPDIENPRILILRFSALGDIAMTAPVVRASALKHPNVLFLVASAPMLEPLFTGIPNLQFESVDTKEFTGIAGFFRLYRKLRHFRPTHLFDLHIVLKTYFLCSLFFVLHGTPIFCVKEGKRQRRQLTSAHRKRLHPLPSMITKYTEVFIRAGFPPASVGNTPASVDNTTASVGNPPASLDNTHLSDCIAPPFKTTLEERGGLRYIGVAPFAKHPTKEWPVEKMEGVIEQLARSGKYRVFLFGGGILERVILKNWEQRYHNTKCVAGSVDFAHELTLIRDMELFISMDSANMHFASYMGVPVLSIWGGTHPYAGFYGWRQAPENAIQTDLACRPCSVFGKKSCRLGTFACFQTITVELVLRRIEVFFEQGTT